MSNQQRILVVTTGVSGLETVFHLRKHFCRHTDFTLVSDGEQFPFEPWAAPERGVHRMAFPFVD